MSIYIYVLPVSLLTIMFPVYKWTFVRNKLIIITLAKRYEGERNTERRSTRLENVEDESSIRRPQIGKQLKKKKLIFIIVITNMINILTWPMFIFTNANNSS